MKTTAIRSAVEGDAETILEFWREAEATPLRTDSYEDLVNLIRSHRESVLVAYEQDRLVGTIIAGWDGWRGHIYRLAVRPNHRRRGIGSCLMAAAEKSLEAKGARRISILVEREDDQAMEFWRSLNPDGLELDERMIRFIKNVGFRDKL
jgi:ribosomal protein S18 acetylase RimI-like enzyme